MEAQTPPRHLPLIRLFISSTFNDLKQERDALQRDVFPDLEEYCQKNGFQFQAIDLRWGVSGEAGLQHRAMQICIEELRRSQDVSPRPNFLILLGNRYGWRPLPEAISQNEFDSLARAASAINERQESLIAGVLDKTALQVLNDWYQQDKNVLVQESEGSDRDREPLIYFLQPRTRNLNDGLDYTRTADQPPKDTPEWNAVQDVLWRIVNAAFSDQGSRGVSSQFPNRFLNVDWRKHFEDIHSLKNPKRAIPQIVRFQGSATEQEIWCGALSTDDAGKHVFAFFREIDPDQNVHDVEILRDYFDGQANPLKPAIPQEEPALTELKRILNERLGANAVTLTPATKLSPIVDANGRKSSVVSEGHLKELCKEVRTRLQAVIDEEIASYRGPSNSPSASPPSATITTITTERELEIERDAHRRFGEERGLPSSFVGRQELLKRSAITYRTLRGRHLLSMVPRGAGSRRSLLGRFTMSPETRRPSFGLLA